MGCTVAENVTGTHATVAMKASWNSFHGEWGVSGDFQTAAHAQEESTSWNGPKFPLGATCANLGALRTLLCSTVAENVTGTHAKVATRSVSKKPKHRLLSPKKSTESTDLRRRTVHSTELIS